MRSTIFSSLEYQILPTSLNKQIAYEEISKNTREIYIPCFYSPFDLAVYCICLEINQFLNTFVQPQKKITVICYDLSYQVQIILSLNSAWICIQKVIYIPWVCIKIKLFLILCHLNLVKEKQNITLLFYTLDFEFLSLLIQVGVPRRQ